MSGPWVGAAAPAENIAALGYDGAPVNALQGRVGPIPIAGTSFARLTCRVARRCSSSGSPT